MNNSLIRPIVCVRRQTFANRIVTHVLPFLLVLRPCPHLRVPAIPLKQRRQAFGRDAIHCVRIVCIRHLSGRNKLRPSHFTPCNCRKRFPLFHPPMEVWCRICRWSAKEVDMVRHYHISADQPVLCIRPCIQNDFQHLTVCKNGISPLRADSHKQDCRAKPLFMHRVTGRMFPFGRDAIYCVRCVCIRRVSGRNKLRPSHVRDHHNTALLPVTASQMINFFSASSRSHSALRFAITASIAAMRLSIMAAISRCSTRGGSKIGIFNIKPSSALGIFAP